MKEVGLAFAAVRDDRTLPGVCQHKKRKDSKLFFEDVGYLDVLI